MRAAAVRRRSIEAEQARVGSKAAVAAGPPGPSMDAEERAAVRAELNKKRLAKETATAKATATTATSGDAEKKRASSPLKSAVADAAPSAEVASTAFRQPTAPKDYTADAAPRPKSRLYTPRAPNTDAEDKTGTSGDQQKPESRPKSTANSRLKASAPVQASALVTGVMSAAVGKLAKPEEPHSPSRPKSAARTDLASPSDHTRAASPARPKSTGPTGTIGSAAAAGVPRAPLSPPASSRPKSSAPPGSAGRTVHQAAATPAPETTDPERHEQTVATELSETVRTDAADSLLPSTDGTPHPTVESAQAPAAEGTAAQQVGGHSGSVVQQEGSEVARSAQASTAETPVEYSTDFENSSAQAEVFKVHD
jgi:hypothetical protein